MYPPFVDRGEVAGVIPAVRGDSLGGLVGPIPVVGHHVRATDRDLAHFVDLAQRLVRASDFHVDTDARRPSARQAAQSIGIAGESQLMVERPELRDVWAHLGHAVALRETAWKFVHRSS